jgi:nitroimidazol reductase NimA-like FMN-containing flavoprotein (pyridoxamine 5'-phosphate oxidase superfamily)
MTPEEVIRQQLPQVNIMQLAAAVNNQPQICTLHFYSDEDFNFYWCSTLDSSHPQAIKQNSQVAAYVLAHENTPEEDYVIGVSIIGQAELLDAETIQKISAAYAEKLAKKPDYVSDIVSGKSPYKFYRLKPSRIVLFDNKDFPDNPRQELQINH